MCVMPQEIRVTQSDQGHVVLLRNIDIVKRVTLHLYGSNCNEHFCWLLNDYNNIVLTNKY